MPKFGHSRNPGYQPGNHWNTCQRCGFDIRASDTIEEWTGLLVCESCWEPRHPQDFVRATVESTEPKWPVTGDPANVLVEQGVDIGDNDVTLTANVDAQIQKFDTTLTANRTVTLSTIGAHYLAVFRINRYDTSAYTIDIGGLVTMPVSTQYYADVQYDGSAWTLLDSGAL